MDKAETNFSQPMTICLCYSNQVVQKICSFTYWADNYMDMQSKQHVGTCVHSTIDTRQFKWNLCNDIIYNKSSCENNDTINCRWWTSSLLYSFIGFVEFLCDESSGNEGANLLRMHASDQLQQIRIYQNTQFPYNKLKCVDILSHISGNIRQTFWLTTIHQQHQLSSHKTFMYATQCANNTHKLIPFVMSVQQLMSYPSMAHVIAVIIHQFG